MTNLAIEDGDTSVIVAAPAFLHIDQNSEIMISLFGDTIDLNHTDNSHAQQHSRH